MADTLFPTRPPDIETQIRAVQREIDMRHQVYGRQVKLGRMTTEKANRQIEDMKAVLRTLTAAKELVETVGANHSDIAGVMVLAERIDAFCATCGHPRPSQVDHGI